jgi:NAD(P)-dependent dehydrogenase (short-subunit alcohol dehydrogenase family)
VVLVSSIAPVIRSTISSPLLRNQAETSVSGVKAASWDSIARCYPGWIPQTSQVARSGYGARMKAMVTGGTSGLGLAMASALAEAGTRVALAGRSGEHARSVAAGLPGAVGIEMDVRDESSVTTAVEQAWAELGGVDLVVNNAGIGMRTVNPRFMTDPQGFWEVSAQGFRAVIETNLVGYFLVAREVTPRMLAAGGGRIVNISVSESTMTRAGFVPYGPSRAGSEAMSRVMAADLAGTGVTVNLLLPGGATATGMVPESGVPAGRQILQPEVMGPPIVWLASEAAAGVHDQRIVAVDFDRWLAEFRNR